ncbi:MAG: leucine-rich repeat domain-containing protein [Pseudomonadota bacterium]
MKFYIVSAGLVFAILFYSFITNAIGFTSDYKFLFRKIYSQENKVYPTRKSVYELAPLIQGSIYKPNYFYLPDRNQYLVKSSVEFADEMDTEAGWSYSRKPTWRYLLLNHQGQVQESFDTEIYFSRYSGIFFSPDFYIEWIESRSTAPKSYARIVNHDLNLSQADFVKAFQEMHAQAEYVEYVYLRGEGSQYEAGVVFKIEGQWAILLSGVRQSYMNQLDTEENPKTGIWDQNYRVMSGASAADFPPSPPLIQLLPLESDIEDPYVFRNYPGAGDIKVNKFEKTHSESIFEVAGIAYVSIKVNQSKFKIKIPDVLKLSIWPIYNLGVRVFKSPKADVKNSLAFVEVTQNAGGSEIREGLGVYVVTERQGENFSVVNDLPEGITEDRFNQLPIALQKALIARETARSLVIEQGLSQWLPEIELLENLTYLSIRGRMTQLPESIAKLKKLQMLYLSMNPIKQLPTSFSQLTNLRYVDLSFTELEHFPEVLLSLPELRKLALGHNFFTEIPADINKLTHLIELDLSGAEITSLPDTMVDMKQLTISTGQYSEFHEQFPDKFQHLFVSKLPDYYEYLEARKNLPE